MDYTPKTPKLTDTAVMQTACEAMHEHLPLKAEGYACTGADLWQMLMGMSVKRTTIHGLCQGLENAPSDATVRGYLNAQLRVDDLKDIEQRFNALAGQIPRRVFKKARDTAVDCTTRRTTARPNKVKDCGSAPQPRMAPRGSTGWPPLTSSGATCG